MRDLGFTLEHGDPALGHDGGRLHVALRDRPTLRHYDPEVVAYWIDREGRGRHAYIDRETPMPRSGRFQWGDVRIADRLGETNRFLVFGGTVEAAVVADGFAVVRFTSPAPILRAGGHSQGVDPIEPEVGAFFGRVMIPIDFQGGAEEAVSAIDPSVLHAAFLVDTNRRLGASRRPDTVAQTIEPLRGSIAHCRSATPDLWAAGGDLLDRLGLGG